MREHKAITYNLCAAGAHREQTITFWVNPDCLLQQANHVSFLPAFSECIRGSWSVTAAGTNLMEEPYGSVRWEWTRRWTSAITYSRCTYTCPHRSVVAHSHMQKLNLAAASSLNSHLNPSQFALRHGNFSVQSLLHIFIWPTMFMEIVISICNEQPCEPIFSLTSGNLAC